MTEFEFSDREILWSLMEDGDIMPDQSAEMRSRYVDKLERVQGLVGRYGFEQAEDILYQKSYDRTKEL